MNIIFKPFVLNAVLVSFLAILIGQIAAYILPNDNFVEFIPKVKKINNTQFDICKAFSLKERKIKKTIIKKEVVKSSGTFLLKDFSISGTFLDGTNSMVIIRDGKGGIFLAIGELYDGYKLVKVFLNKAKFEKNGDIYFAFLTPKDEKEFKGVAKRTISEKTITTREKISTTTARGMFDDIKYKNGTYFISKNMLSIVNWRIL